jgi:hypothetical protein
MSRRFAAPLFRIDCPASAPPPEQNVDSSWQQSVLAPASVRIKDRHPYTTRAYTSWFSGSLQKKPGSLPLATSTARASSAAMQEMKDRCLRSLDLEEIPHCAAARYFIDSSVDFLAARYGLPRS